MLSPQQLSNTPCIKCGVVAVASWLEPRVTAASRLDGKGTGFGTRVAHVHARSEETKPFNGFFADEPRAAAAEAHGEQATAPAQPLTE